MALLPNLLEIPKRLIAFGPVTARLARSQAFVLLYHRVLPEAECADAKANHALNVSTTNFDAHLKYLKSEFDVVPLSSLVKSLPPNNKQNEKPKLAITFDDGWKDNHDHAWPLLKKHNLPATIFLVSDHIESGAALWWSALEEHFKSLGNISVAEWASTLVTHAKNTNFPDIEAVISKRLSGKSATTDDIIDLFKSIEHDQIEGFVGSLLPQNGVTTSRELITWEQARKMQGNCIEFGAHTRRHELLTELDEQAIKDTVNGSCQALMDNDIEPIRVFSYPNGNCDTRVQQVVADIGFKCAVGTKRGTFPGSKANMMAMPRINIGGGNEANLNLLRRRLARAYWFQK